MMWQKSLSILLLILLPVAINCSSEEVETFSKDLDSTNFDEAIKGNNHFVMFFAPWCGHCKRLHPLWEQLAEMMNVKDDPKVVIAKVDCTKQQELCGKNEITGYPTLRLFKLGEEESIKFKGTRDMPAITEFINKHLNTDELNEIPKEDDEEVPVVPVVAKGKLVELTEENFAKHVSSGNHFVKFYAPWCSHCQRLAPTWEELAKSLSADLKVSIGKLDCTQHRSICQDFEVKGYPTLLWIEDGKKIEKYAGSRDHDALKAYVEKMLGGEVVKQQQEEKPKKTEENTKQVLQLVGAEDFQSAIAKGVAFIKFYAPWCGHCQKLSPTWDQLAEKMNSGPNGVKIAKVDCTNADNRNLCSEQQVEGYPTLFAYKNGEKQSEYDGSRALSELQQYVNKIVGHDEL